MLSNIFVTDEQGLKRLRSLTEGKSNREGIKAMIDAQREDEEMYEDMIMAMRTTSFNRRKPNG